uniref:PSI subunit V n=1 Tax=Neotessella volvocina TaxID=52559 RepID=A0A3G2R0R8_9STRA|nr:photosystem I subunit XI [Neotessella volvocina]
MIINKANNFDFFTIEKEGQLTTTPTKNFDMITAYEGDPFAGHLSTPVTTSFLTKTYLGLLPAYKKGLTPLLRGINVGYAHGYFLLGPFVKLGPLRDSEVANFVGYISNLSLIIILTTGLLIYGFARFPENEITAKKHIAIDFLNAKGWREFTSGFIVGGFGGSSVAYLLIKIFTTFS